MNRAPLGIVGLGLLGTALTERLLAAGYSLVGFDVDPDRRTQFATVGGRAVDSAAAVAASCRRILLALPDSLVVAQVLRDLAPQLQPDSWVADATTGRPADAVARATELRAVGSAYLDTPVVGSSQQVRTGQAVMLVGGDAPAVAALRDVLEACAARYFVVGPPGSAARLKLIVNLVLGLNRAALAEGLHLAGACGLDLRQTLDVLSATPAASAVMATKGPKMIAADFTPQARLAQHQKDVGLILDLARQAGVRVPLSATHADLLERAVALGLGALDNSAILRAFE